MVMISEEEFDMVVVGIAMMLAVVESTEDEQQKEDAAKQIMKGLALIRVGVFSE